MQGKETKKQAAVESEKFHSKELRLSKEVIPGPESNFKFLFMFPYF